MRTLIAAIFTALLLSGIAVRGWAIGEVGGVKGGANYSLVPVYEALQFGDSKATIQRDPVQIPADYGQLVTITPTKGGVVLWFRSETDIVRNVPLADGHLWMIQRSGNLAISRR